MRLHLLMRYVWLLIPTSHLLHLSSQKCLRIATARAHETSQDLVCRLLLEKKKTKHKDTRKSRCKWTASNPRTARLFTSERSGYSPRSSLEPRHSAHPLKYETIRS